MVVMMTMIHGNKKNSHLQNTSITPYYPHQGKIRMRLCFQDVLVALLVGLNHAKSYPRKLGQFFFGKMGLLSNGL